MGQLNVYYYYRQCDKIQYAFRRTRIVLKLYAPFTFLLFCAGSGSASDGLQFICWKLFDGSGINTFNRRWSCNVPNWPSVRSFDLMCNCFNFWNETNFCDLFCNRRDRCVVKRIGCFSCYLLEIGRNWWLTLLTVAHTAHVSDMYKKAFILNLCTADESINRILKRTDSKNIDNCGGFLK